MVRAQAQMIQNYKQTDSMGSYGRTWEGVQITFTQFQGVL